MSGDERSYGAGEDIPGTPGPFPFGLVSFALSVVAVIASLAAMIVGSPDWIPTFYGQSALYLIALAGCFVCAGLAVRQGRWGWAIAATVIAVVSLTPIFPFALVLLVSGVK